MKNEMKWFFALLVTGVVLGMASGYVYKLSTHTVTPQVLSDAALKQAEDTDAGAREARMTMAAASDAASFSPFRFGMSVFSCFWFVVLLYFLRRKAAAGSAVLLSVMVLLAGCEGRRPYDKPEYVDVGSSETAFVIPLEGDSGKQVKLDSESAYLAYRIMEKRIQVPKRWNQTGKREYQGDWIPVVKVIKVDRSPVTREWDPEKENGTKGIWTESSDSVGFSCGITCTAYIAESDAAKFLYWYPTGSLASVMDQELRARIQQGMSEFCARYPMDTLREKKVEMMQSVRDDVNKFFQSRGMTVSTIGMFGGFTYENKQIQDSIDAVFVAQQEKSKEKALLEAMDSKKKRMSDEGMAEANRSKAVAQGEADAIIMRKKAEAEGITLVNDALDKAQGNPLFIQLKGLEVESERIRKWNGSVPTMVMGGNAVPMIQVPQVQVPPVQPDQAPAGQAVVRTE